MKSKLPEKPSDWPANNREKLIDDLVCAMASFQKKPSPQTREVIVSLANTFELNQSSSLGVSRVTEYEVMQINSLYLNASFYQFTSVKSLLYELVAETTMVHKLTYQIACSSVNEFDFVVSEHIDAYLYMITPLLVFHVAYQGFIWEKKLTLCQHLIQTVRFFQTEGIIKIGLLSAAFVNMLTDIGYMRGTKREELIRFSRDELQDLFSVEAELLRESGQNPIKRPLKGMMMIQLSNLILKSRNGYHKGLVYKCVSRDVAVASFNNGQIWMRKVEELNDDRECCVIPELLKDTSWLKKDWLRGFELKPTRKYYVSSFSKVLPDDIMRRKYGSCVYGFKGDKLTELIGPVEKRHWVKRDAAGAEIDSYDDYALEQVVPMDVIYGRRAVKAELSYVCHVVDLLPMSREEKFAFFKELVQYWILSAKDAKWASEHERRYVLFTYENAEYLNTKLDGAYHKVPTTIFQYPDVALGDNPILSQIRSNIDAKRKAMVGRQYFFCHDCLLRDQDLVAGNVAANQCPICGSYNIEVVI